MSLNLLLNGNPTSLKNVTVANHFRTRLHGLSRHRFIPDSDALLIPDCRLIHTLTMHIPIGVIFLDKSWRVVSFKASVMPKRCAGNLRASQCIELRADHALFKQLKPQDAVRLQPC